jgi:hypothetical protein
VDLEGWDYATIPASEGRTSQSAAAEKAFMPVARWWRHVLQMDGSGIPFGQKIPISLLLQSYIEFAGDKDKPSGAALVTELASECCAGLLLCGQISKDAFSETVHDVMEMKRIVWPSCGKVQHVTLPTLADAIRLFDAENENKIKRPDETEAKQ